jgi:hypothetical protein
MVEVEWLVPLMRFQNCAPYLVRVVGYKVDKNLNARPGGATRRKWRIPDGKCESGLMSYSKLQGGSPLLCWLRTASVGSWWASIDYVLMHTGHMKSCKLSGFDGHRVGRSLTSPIVMYTRIVYGPPMDSPVCGITWKTYIRERCGPARLLTVVTNCDHSCCLHGSRLSCCQVISLERCVLIWISVTLSGMSDDLLPHPNVVIELHLGITCILRWMMIMIITYITSWLILLAWLV